MVIYGNQTPSVFENQITFMASQVVSNGLKMLSSSAENVNNKP